LTVTFAASMLAGLPPFGLGLYARDTIEPLPWAFVAVNAWRSDAAQQVEQARARGAAVWLYGTPEHFQPATWRDGLARLERMSSALPVVGIIADAETEWPSLVGSARAEAATAFGLELARLSSSTRVGFTSYPSFPALAELAAAAGRGVWGSPQIYGRTSQDAETFATWFDSWRIHFGARCIPSIAGWAASPSMSSAEGFAAYLSRLPHAPGAIVWDGAGNMPSAIRDGLASFHPGGSSAGTASAIARTVAAHPPFIVAAIVVAIVVALFLGFGVR
jgi:hypothetical protein